MDEERKEWNEYFVKTQAKFINAADKTWIQEDGKCLMISEMTYEHLENAIRYIDKKLSSVEHAPIYAKYVKKMKRKKSELKRELKNRKK